MERVLGNPLPKQGRNNHQVRRPSSPTVTLPYHQRQWIDVEPGKFDKSGIEVPRKMIRLLRHDPSVLRVEDGAVEFRILASMFRLGCTSFSVLVYSNMAESLAKKEEDPKRDFSIVWIHTLLRTILCTFEQFKDILEENTSILHCKTTCRYRATSPSTSASLEAPTTCTRSGWHKGDMWCVFTAVNQMSIDHH